MAFKARWSSPCLYCNNVIAVGEEISWVREPRKFDAQGNRIAKKVYHLKCIPATQEVKTQEVKTDTVKVAARPIKGKASAGSIEEALKQFLQENAAKTTVDKTEVMEIVADEFSRVMPTIHELVKTAAQSATRTLEIKVENKPTVKLSRAHRDIDDLIKLVSTRNHQGHRLNVYLYGPAGSGKSTAAHQVAKALGLPFGYISLNPMSPDSCLKGYPTANGSLYKTELFKFYTEGGVYCIDEADNSSSQLLNTLNSMLENGSAEFGGQRYERHADFICIATGNTNGNGPTIQYPDRRPLGLAFRDRFKFLSWDYDMTLTRDIVLAIYGGDTVKTDSIFSWVETDGGALAARKPTVIIGPRAFIESATLEVAGFPRRKIFDMAIAKGEK